MLLAKTNSPSLHVEVDWLRSGARSQEMMAICEARIEEVVAPSRNLVAALDTHAASTLAERFLDAASPDQIGSAREVNAIPSVVGPQAVRP
jgi:hypothetical protein